MNQTFNTQDRRPGSAPSSCCVPDRSEPANSSDEPATISDGSGYELVAPDLVRLTGGFFAMGTDDPIADPADFEGPVRQVEIRPFAIAATTVTNVQFATFVDATGYRTTAESTGWSFVFAGLLADEIGETRGVAGATWWREVRGAAWRTPEGGGSSIEHRLEHPVVHVSRADAEAFCRWAGVRLPTEREWEFAARGGLEQARYPWGDELELDGTHRCNVWQGEFPSSNSGDDGWIGTAPARWYHPNGYGLYQMVGNVWEWCSGPFDPAGHSRGDDAEAVVRGGSYLCHESYCARYRVSARSRSTRLSTTGHTGLRVAADSTGLCNAVSNPVETNREGGAW